MVNKDVKVTDEEISDLVTKRVHEILKLNTKTVENDEFQKRREQAKLGMEYVRDREVMKRINNGQNIRVVTLITNDPDTRKAYIEASMPQFQIFQDVAPKPLEAKPVQ